MDSRSPLQSVTVVPGFLPGRSLSVPGSSSPQTSRYVKPITSAMARRMRGVARRPWITSETMGRAESACFERSTVVIGGPGGNGFRRAVGSFGLRFSLALRK